MGLIGVVLAPDRLVAAAEPDEVDRDGAQPRVDQHRDHPAVQVAPGRLAVQQQHDRRVGGTLVEVMHAEAVDLDVVGGERKIGEVGEALVRGTQNVHALT